MIIWLQSSKWKFWNYWSESNSWIYFYIILNKNWKNYCSEQSFTGLEEEDRCSSWELLFAIYIPCNYQNILETDLFKFPYLRTGIQQLILGSNFFQHFCYLAYMKFVANYTKEGGNKKKESEKRVKLINYVYPKHKSYFKCLYKVAKQE